MSDNEDRRPPLDVTHSARFHDWLVLNVGTQVPGFYVREGDLVRVPRLGQDGYRPLTGNDKDRDGPAQIRPADTTCVRAVLARQRRCFRIVRAKEGALFEEEILPPFDPVNVYLAGVAECDTAAPRLSGVVHAPFVRPDGSVVDRPGYDPDTQLLYLPPAALKLPPIPDHPTTEDVRAATALLLDVVAEFPFVEDHDRASYVGALLLGPMLRPLVRPPYPIVALNAHMAGSGKSLLAAVAMELHGGVFRSDPSYSDEEIRKQITSILRCTSSPLVVLDNLTGTFRSGQFAAMATSAVWTDRPLGSTAQVEAPNDRIWVLTGNNLSLGGDLPRRVAVWSRIDANVPEPHLRSGFRIPQLIEHVRDRRGDLLAAALVLVRAWVLDGCPQHGPERHDSYGTWLRSVAGLLQIAGVPGEFASVEVARLASPVGSEDDEASGWLRALHQRFPDGFHARDVVELIRSTEERQRNNSRADAGNQWASSVPISGKDVAVVEGLPDDLAEKTGKPGFSKSVGRWLQYRIGQWKGSYALRSRTTDRDGVRKYHVEEYVR